MFKYIENADPMKQKQLAKGIDQLMDEGVAQLFVNQFNGRKIIGTVDVYKRQTVLRKLTFEFRHESEFNRLHLIVFETCFCATVHRLFAVEHC